MVEFRGSQLKRLRDAIAYSRKTLEPFRKKRLEALRQYVGNNYSDDGAGDKVPMNLLELAVNIYLRHLVARRPRVLVQTPFRQLKPRASKLELGLNHLITEIGLADTLEDAARNALFLWGVVHTGLGIYGDVEIDGVTHDVGQPFADVIDEEDWVYDVQARRYESVAFAGHRYRLPLEYVRQSSLFKNTENLKATHFASQTNEGEDRVSEISRGSSAEVDQGEYEEYVELGNYWIPRENLILTLPEGDSDAPPVREVDYEGPERGPYNLLSFCRVPGQVVPLAPRAIWMDLHDLVNRLFRKLGRQAERQKTILGYRGAAAGDAQRVVNAADGEAVQMDSPESMKEFRFGGVDAPNLAFLIQTIQQFSWFSGNLDALGPQSETLGQDRLLAGSASRRIQEMQDRMVDFTTRVVQDLGWYLWTDPYIELPLVKRVAGTDVEIPTKFTPEDREGDFYEYNLSIEPYSMQYQSPADRLQLLQNVLQTIITPNLPLMQQQGVGLNMLGVLRLIGRYANMPELEEVIESQEPVLGQEGPVQPGGTRPANTTRRYVRVNQPAGTRQGRDAALAQTLLGARVQDADLAGLLRMNSGR